MTLSDADQGSRLLGLLVCPADGAHLRQAGPNLDCPACPTVFGVADEIPILLMEPGLESHDELTEHAIGGTDHKFAQAAFFDYPSAVEFETTRPHGAPAIYQWVLEEKLRRSVVGIESVLPGMTALVVCGGSGMDAEFLARAGAWVVSSDISLGAAKRAAARAQRYSRGIRSIVADAEQLPFANRSIDVVAVHDGLHHLEDPFAAIAEMTRVAAHAVSISEPADAALTGLAVRFGLAREREEAGNRVARLRLDDVVQFLQARGFSVVYAKRHAIYYRHVPGRSARLMSRPVLFPLVKAAVRLGDRILGTFGNKLTVVAVRAE